MSEAAAEEVERVQKIVAEADDPDYWYHASRDGSREGHYKSEWRDGSKEGHSWESGMVIMFVKRDQCTPSGPCSTQA